MRVKGVSQRLDFSTRRLSRAEWRLLGAIAVERELARSLVVKLGGTFGVLEAARPRASAAGVGASSARGAQNLPTLERGAKDAWPALDDWQASGLIVELGVARGAGSFARGTNEATLAVNAEFRELVVRRLAREGDLALVVEATRVLLGDRSFGVFALLLQTGELAEFQRHAYLVARAAGRLLEPIDSDVLLRDAITRPFDPDWFAATFRGAGLAAAQKVLRDALTTLDECDELLSWSVSELDRPAPEAAVEADERSNASVNSTSLGQTIAEHAVLRGRLELAEERAALLPLAQRWPIDAATHFQSADLGGALRLLDNWQQSKAAAPDAGAIVPLLALISYGRGTPAGVADAKRLMMTRTADPSKGGLDRAFRTFFRYGAQPESEHIRLDVHQLARGASAWELFVLALTVHLYLKQDVTRASWAVRLVHASAEWIEAGYSWIGRQGLFLARALSPEYFQREFEAVRARLFLDALDARPGELILSELIQAKPDWERALEALAELADQPSEEADTSRRVAWFVNMVDGSIERPSLQELKRGGWSKGRRLTLAQLWPLASELPREDQAVIANTRDTGPDKREFLPEAIEALINHPRVFNGARGGQRVEVVRGTPRVETRDERGFLSIYVEPRGARLGVNVVIEGEARLLVYRVTPAMHRVVELLPEGLRIPKERESQALAVLGKLSRGVEVQSTHLGADREVEANATPCLRIAPEAGSWLVQIGVRPFGDHGRFFIAGAGKATLSLYTGGERLICTRELLLEKARVSSLIQSCQTLLERTLDLDARAPGEGRESWDFTETELLELLLELSECGEPYALEWPESTAIRMRGRASGKSLHGSLRRKKGWYLATGGLRLDDGTEIAIAELTQGNVVAGGRFVRLPNGDFVAIEERIRRVMTALASAEPISPKSPELRIHEGALAVLGTLSDQKSGEGGFALDTEAEAWLERAAALQNQEFNVPSAISAELRRYQLDGFRWLSRLAALGLGACLADDMGLGKTIEILALLAGRTGEGPTLVVAPTSVCANWMREAARFAPSLGRPNTPARNGPSCSPSSPRTRSESRHPARGVQLRAVATGRRRAGGDRVGHRRARRGAVHQERAVTARARRDQAARAQPHRRDGHARREPPRRSVEHLQLHQPRVARSLAYFNRRFVKPIEQRGEDVVRQTPAGADPAVHPAPHQARRAGRAAAAHRRAPQRAAERERGARYALLRRQIHEKLFTTHGKRENKIEVLAEITRLRRFCCHPRLVFPDADRESSKISAMLELVHELRENQHRALVFSQFVDFLELVREQLDEAAHHLPVPRRLDAAGPARRARRRLPSRRRQRCS